MTGLSYLILTALLAVFAMMLSGGARIWLSFTFVALLAIIGLYVFDMLRMPADVRWYFMSPGDYEGVLALSLAFVGFFGVGEYMGYRKGYRNPLHVSEVRYSRTWVRLGVAVVALGFIGQILFIQASGGFFNLYGAPHGAGANFTTAYIYRLPHSMFTGALILLAFVIRGQKLSPLVRAVLVFAMIMVAFDLVTQGKRGGVIRFALMVVIPLIVLDAMTRRRTLLLMGGAAVSMVFLVILPYIRQALSLTRWSELGSVVSGLPEAMDKYSRGYTLYLEGKHAVFASVVVGGAVENPDPNFGLRWLFPFVNLVPRAIWPDKPLRYDFAYDFYDVTYAYTNIHIPPGSYPGGIAESFVEWSYFVVVVWFVQGLVLGYIRGRAMSKKTLFSIVLLYSSSAFFVFYMLQDMIQATFTFLYLFGPFLVLYFVSRLVPRRDMARAGATMARNVR